MKYLSLFSGVGGFELGIQQAYERMCIEKQREGKGVRDKERLDSKCSDLCEDGLACIGFSEIDKYSSKVYQHHFPNHHAYGDITKINEQALPDFELLVGGVPCQSWSIAGKRGGFDDERGNMWFQCTKILRAKQPKFFLFENVKGLLSHDGGKSMGKICEELCDCGYAIDFEVLNSKNFGVPQNRERVFIVGVRLDLIDKCQLF